MNNIIGSTNPPVFGSLLGQVEVLHPLLAQSSDIPVVQAAPPDVSDLQRIVSDAVAQALAPLSRQVARLSRRGAVVQSSPLVVQGTSENDPWASGPLACFFEKKR